MAKKKEEVVTSASDAFQQAQAEFFLARDSYREAQKKFEQAEEREWQRKKR